MTFPIGHEVQLQYAFFQRSFKVLKGDINATL